jgi:hypothetical protein
MGAETAWLITGCGKGRGWTVAQPRALPASQAAGGSHPHFTKLAGTLLLPSLFPTTSLAQLSDSLHRFLHSLHSLPLTLLQVSRWLPRVWMFVSRASHWLGLVKSQDRRLTTIMVARCSDHWSWTDVRTNNHLANLLSGC